MNKYTNFVLTVIAILLALHLVKPFFTTNSVTANQREIDVNIASVGGRSVNINSFDMGPFDSGIPVFITKDKDKF